MQVDIAIELQLDSPVHIGSGALADSLADKPMLKDARHWPLIPGSSLKGKTRHACEQIAQSLGVRRRMCSAPYPDRMCVPDSQTSPCPVCRVFGAPGLHAPVRFGNLSLRLAPDVLAPRGQKWERRLEVAEIRAGVGLSRTQRTAQEDILYTIETFRQTPALVYEGAITGELSERGAVALLIAGLRALRMFGGARSRGLGWGRIVSIVKLDSVPQDVVTLMEELPTWLRSI